MSMTLMKCPDCGRDVSPRAKFCVQCGAPVGSKLDHAGAWCPHCGNRDSAKSVAGAPAFGVIAVVVMAVPVLFFVTSLTMAGSPGIGGIGALFTFGSAFGVLIPAAILAIVWVLLPRRWVCGQCKNVWRA